MAQETVVKGKKKKENKPEAGAWNPAPASVGSAVFSATGVRTRQNWTLRSKIGHEKKVADERANYVPFVETQAKDVKSLLAAFACTDPKSLLKMLQNGINGASRQSAAFKEARVQAMAEAALKIKPSLNREKVLARCRAIIAEEDATK